MKSSTHGSTAVAERARRAEPKAMDLIFSQREARQLLSAFTALKNGDGSVRLPLEWTGMQGKVAETFNDVVDLNERMAEELARLRQRVGKEGKLKQRASLGDVRGFWQDSGELGQRADRRPGAPDQRNRARDRRRGAGRPVADHGAGDRRPSAGGRVPAHREDRSTRWWTSSRRSPRK